MTNLLPEPIQTSTSFAPKPRPEQQFGENWFDIEGVRHEGPMPEKIVSFYEGQDFAQVLSDYGLITEADRPLTELFVRGNADPVFGIDDGLRHSVIGDRRGGGHLLSAMQELVPNFQPASSIKADTKAERKSLRRQHTQDNGVFSLVGAGALGTYLADGEQRWFGKRGKRNTFFPIDWRVGDVLKATAHVLDQSTEIEEHENKIEYDGFFKGVGVRILTDRGSGKVLSIFPTPKQDA